jgi:hypothetical protein
MAEHWNDPEWDADPEEVIWEEWEPDEPAAAVPDGGKYVVSVTHDLTDDELRRFCNFDVFYDPMPSLGFIPQWAWFAGVIAVASAIIAFALFRSKTAAVLGGLVVPIVVVRLQESAAESRRQQARALGLCDGRIVSVSPRGLSVRIPDAEETEMTGVGPLTRLWIAIRKISRTDEDLMFWLRPGAGDTEGRMRVVVPLRVFAGPAEADEFESTARRWYAEAGGENAWLGEDELL